MFRKFACAALAAASLGLVALTPTSASAGWHGGWHRPWHGGWAGGWHGPRVVVGPGYYAGGCMVRRWVPTPWGPRWRVVNRCY